VTIVTLLRDLVTGRAAGRIGALAGIAFFGIITWGVLSRGSPLFGRMVERGPAGCRAVALTFDDGPSRAATPAVLEILRGARAPATFFLIGGRAVLAPDLVRRIRAEGTPSAITASPYQPFVFTTRAGSRGTSEDGRSCRNRRRRPSGFVRWPYGIWDLRRIVRRSGRPVVGWSVYPADARRPAAETLVRRVLDRAGPGDILLLHDGGGDRSATVAALPRILDGLRVRHLAVIPLADLLAGRCP
jgi:peptidoglycan/xylan/chitin deacetylase (PgdA/CDA1 family)